MLFHILNLSLISEPPNNNSRFCVLVSVFCLNGFDNSGICLQRKKMQHYLLPLFFSGACVVFFAIILTVAKNVGAEVCFTDMFSPLDIIIVQLA